MEVSPKCASYLCNDRSIYCNLVYAIGIRDWTFVSPVVCPISTRIYIIDTERELDCEPIGIIAEQTHRETTVTYLLVN